MLVAVSVVPRLVPPRRPPLDRHDFRQTQTAITVQSFLDHGVKVLRHETPVLGPPWRCPSSSRSSSSAPTPWRSSPRSSSTSACRLTAVLWFYASAWILFVLVRRWATPRLAALSLAALRPEPVLGHLEPRGADRLRLGGARPSATSTPRCCGASSGRRGRGSGRDGPRHPRLPHQAHHRGHRRHSRSRWRSAGACAAPGGLARAVRARTSLGVGLVAALVLGVPFVAGVLWTRWADAIKAAQPATATLTSSALTTWNFGTWSSARRGRPGRRSSGGSCALSSPRPSPSRLSCRSPSSAAPS